MGDRTGNQSLLKEALRVESNTPVYSFTFVVDEKIKETSLTKCTRKFEFSTLSGNERPLVARSSIEPESPSIVNVGRHSFVESAILAYNQHLHLVMRPDDVWLALVTQFSFYVSANAEALRSKFVAFDGKKELVVHAGGSLHTAPYEALALMMTDQIAANIKDPSVRDWVLPGFSTTSNTDKVVGAFALMATLKEYFDYKFCLMCGLPKVTILGSVDDWRQVRLRAERFLEFDNVENYMKQWVDMLLPVLDHFVRSAEGKSDTKWWNRIAHYVGGGSGPRYISGWITVFMVFSSEGKWMGDQKGSDELSSEDEEPSPPAIDETKEGEDSKGTGRESETEWLSQKETEGYATKWTFVDTEDIPKGYITCPLKIDDNGTEYDAEIYAGHIVSKFINDNTTIVPQLDWCIMVKNNEPVHEIDVSNLLLS